MTMNQHSLGRILRRMYGEIFSFPHPVNEYAARVVAAMVVLLTAVIILADLPQLMGFLVYGFLARVFTGPNLSPMGLLATRVIVPILGNPIKDVPGPPKRFAQFVGLLFSGSALVLHFVLGLESAAMVVLLVLLFFATLESVVGFCTGCFVFNYLMRWGFIPQETCEKCARLTFH